MRLFVLEAKREGPAAALRGHLRMMGEMMAEVNYDAIAAVVERPQPGLRSAALVGVPSPSVLRHRLCSLPFGPDFRSDLPSCGMRVADISTTADMSARGIAGMGALGAVRAGERAPAYGALAEAPGAGRRGPEGRRGAGRAPGAGGQGARRRHSARGSKKLQRGAIGQRSQAGRRASQVRRPCWISSTWAA